MAREKGKGKGALEKKEGWSEKRYYGQTDGDCSGGGGDRFWRVVPAEEGAGIERKSPGCKTKEA